jgi:hypothetical protein
MTANRNRAEDVVARPIVSSCARCGTTIPEMLKAALNPAAGRDIGLLSFLFVCQGSATLGRARDSRLRASNSRAGFVAKYQPWYGHPAAAKAVTYSGDEEK